VVVSDTPFCGTVWHIFVVLSDAQFSLGVGMLGYNLNAAFDLLCCVTQSVWQVKTYRYIPFVVFSDTIYIYIYL